MTVRPSPDITRGLLSEAIQIFGSQSKLAAATGRSQNAVWHALKNGRVSAEFAMAIDGQTMWGTGVEQILIAWLTLGINPLCRRIEARVTKDLVPLGQKRRIQFEFNREGLLQADSKAKAEYLSTMVQNALMTRNEARSKLNLSKVPGGDTLTAQTNLAPLDQLGQGGGDVGAHGRR